VGFPPVIGGSRGPRQPRRGGGSPVAGASSDAGSAVLRRARPWGAPAPLQDFWSSATAAPDQALAQWATVLPLVRDARVRLFSSSSAAGLTPGGGGLPVLRFAMRQVRDVPRAARFPPVTGGSWGPHRPRRYGGSPRAGGVADVMDGSGLPARPMGDRLAPGARRASSPTFVVVGGRVDPGGGRSSRALIRDATRAGRSSRRALSPCHRGKLGAAPPPALRRLALRGRHSLCRLRARVAAPGFWRPRPRGGRRLRAPATFEAAGHARGMRRGRRSLGRG